MKCYSGTEVIKAFEDDKVSDTSSAFMQALAKNQKRIIFESGRYALHNIATNPNVPYSIGQTVNVTYQGCSVTIDKGQEICNENTSNDKRYT